MLNYYSLTVLKGFCLFFLTLDYQIAKSVATLLIVYDWRLF